MLVLYSNEGNLSQFFLPNKSEGRNKVKEEEKIFQSHTVFFEEFHFIQLLFH